MSEIAPIERGVVEPVVVEPVRGREAESRAEIRRGVDFVEVSEMATYLSRLREMPEVRDELVASVRNQIAAGSYETPERLSAAIDQMLRDLETGL